MASRLEPNAGSAKLSSKRYASARARSRGRACTVPRRDFTLRAGTTTLRGTRRADRRHNPDAYARCEPCNLAMPCRLAVPC